MALRSFAPCRVCQSLTRNKGGLCNAHQNEQGWARHQAGKTQTQRGYGVSWRKLRRDVLIRDAYICSYNLTHADPLLDAKCQVDHYIPKAQGGTDDMANLRAICPQCHAVKTAREGGR